MIYGKKPFPEKTKQKTFLLNKVEQKHIFTLTFLSSHLRLFASVVTNWFIKEMVLEEYFGMMDQLVLTNVAGNLT